MATKSPSVWTGSQILLEKVAPYNQCKAYTERSNVNADSIEGNQLLGGPSRYSLLTVSRGVHQAIEVADKKADSAFSSAAVVDELSRLLCSRFQSIQKNMASQSRKVQWLEVDEPSTDGNLNELNELYSGAIALQTNLEVVVPAVGVLRSYKRSRNIEVGLPAAKRGRAEVSGTLCRYGTTFIGHAASVIPSPDAFKTLRAIRRTEASSLKETQKSSVRRNDINSLVQHIRSSTNSGSKAEGAKKKDQFAVQTYLKRHLWILNQTRSNESNANTKWSEMGEGERVATEMKHGKPISRRKAS